jgi:hypothetical protein
MSGILVFPKVANAGTRPTQAISEPRRSRQTLALFPQWTDCARPHQGCRRRNFETRSEGIGEQWLTTSIDLIAQSRKNGRHPSLGIAPWWRSCAMSILTSGNASGDRNRTTSLPVARFPRCT